MKRLFTFILITALIFIAAMTLTAKVKIVGEIAVFEDSVKGTGDTTKIINLTTYYGKTTNGDNYKHPLLTPRNVAFTWYGLNDSININIIYYLSRDSINWSHGYAISNALDTASVWYFDTLATDAKEAWLGAQYIKVVFDGQTGNDVSTGSAVNFYIRYAERGQKY